MVRVLDGAGQAVAEVDVPIDKPIFTDRTSGLAGLRLLRPLPPTDQDTPVPDTAASDSY